MSAAILTRLKPDKMALVVVMMALAYAFSSTSMLQRVDFLLYDYFLNWQQNRVGDQVIVVAIDDASLQAIGRWPWSRRTHAQLLDILTSNGARAVGLDIIFAEPEDTDPTADRALAEALARSGRTIVAIAPSNPLPNQTIDEVLPLPMLAEHAAGLGHVDIEIDSDGLCRSVYLYAGSGNAHWPALSLALLRLGGVSPPVDSAPARRSAMLSQGWQRDGRYFIPFDPRPDALQAVSYFDVLNDPRVAARVKDKFVLVGATATGLGDVVSTPVSVDHQRMPGVELNAHILGGLLSGRLTREVNRATYKTLTLLITGLAALLMLLPAFQIGFVLFMAGVAGIMAFCALLLFGPQLWFPPAAALAPLFIGFAIWGTWSLLREQRINDTLAARVEHQAWHHSATDLPNQYALEHHLRELDHNIARHSDLAALMLVHIKWPGSGSGIAPQVFNDQLLRAIADRLRESVAEDDLIVHLNGDDFGILVNRLSDPADALKVAQDLLNTLRQPIHVDDAQVFLVPRMGLSIWPTESADGSALLRDAYVAMYRARVEQSTRTCVYSATIAREVHTRSQLEQALISAMQNDEFEVYYQPQVDHVSGDVVGVEALLRWHNPKLGLVYPATFIPVAEHNGQIQEIGNWVLRTACQQVQSWNAQGLGPLRLAVNLSPLQFGSEGIVHEVRNALRDSGLGPNMLELEITESTLVENMEAVTRAMRMLKGLGVQLAIDDFGTGYSSLSNLQHFPLDRIKIDQSFTRELENNDSVREITLTIIGMAKRLNLQVIAEGVERQSQAEFLGHNQCDEMQGYYFGYPLPARDIEEMLEQGRRSVRAPAADKRAVERVD